MHFLAMKPFFGFNYLAPSEDIVSVKYHHLKEGLGDLANQKKSFSGLEVGYFCCGRVAQAVQRPSKVPVWCNSAVSSIPGHGKGQLQ